MNSIIKSVALLSSFSLTASPASTQNVHACELPPSLISPLATGSFIVSTYHITGVPGTNRVIQVQWPSEIENPLSGVPPGRTDGATRTLLFDIPSGEVSVKSEHGDIDQVALPGFTVLVGNGVDRYPLYSSLGSVGGMPSKGGRTLLVSETGSTYHSSEGFETFPDEDHGDWIRYAYPDPNRVSNRYDTFFRGVPEFGKVEVILRCRRWEDGPTDYSQCNLYKKREPIFYRIRFDGGNIEDLPVIEYVAGRLMECVLGDL